MFTKFAAGVGIYTGRYDCFSFYLQVAAQTDVYGQQCTGTIRQIHRELAVGRSHHWNVVKRRGELTTADIRVPFLDRNSAWIHTAKEVKSF